MTRFESKFVETLQSHGHWAYKRALRDALMLVREAGRLPEARVEEVLEKFLKEAEERW